MTGAPTRTHEQRESALERANEIRVGNAAIKRKMRSYLLTLEQALEQETCQSAYALDLVMAIPGVGRVKALKAIHTLGMSPSKRVRGLSQRQSRALIAWSRPYDRRRKLGGPVRAAA